MRTANQLAKTTANIGFLLLFPGFFFWHISLAVGLPLPAIGWWGQVAALILALGALLAVKNCWRLTFTPYLIWVCAFITYCALWTVVNFLNGAPPVTVTQSATTIGSWIALVFVGLFFEPSRRNMRAFFVSLVAMAAVIVIYREGASFNAAATFGAENIASYQGFSRSLMITSIVVLSAMRKPGRRIALSMATAALLFLTIARSEFAAFVLTMAAMEGARGFRRPVGWAALIGWLGIGVILAWYSLDVLSQSRQLQLLDLSRSTSWIARQEYGSIAWAQITSNPIVGSFGGHYLQTGDLGGYAHNALSAWVSFSLFGFVGYVGLTAWAAVRSGLWMFSRPTMRQCLSAYLNISAFILIVAAKPVFWPLAALGWGAYVSARREAGTSRAQFATRSACRSPMTRSCQEWGQAG